MEIAAARKLWSMLTSAERRGALGLLGLMLVGMVLETLGVGLVIPALALMTQRDLAIRYPALQVALDGIGNPPRETLVIYGMAALVAIYVIKAAFLAFLAWRQMRFVYRLQTDLSERLFASYLGQPYTFHIQRNSAQLIRNVFNEVNILAQNAVMQGLTFLAESLVVIGILSLLLYIEPAGALLAAGTLVVAGLGFHRLTRNRILAWGKARHVHEGMRLQHLQQGLGGVKEVKLLGREAEFLAQYRMHASTGARMSQRQTTLAQFPRLMLEVLAVLALALLVVAMIGQGRSLETLLPTIGVFATAAFRIMPSANRIMTAMQTVRYAQPVVNAIYQEMVNVRAAVPPAHTTRMPFTRTLELQNLHFRYPNAESESLRDICLRIEAGAAIGFIGGSGAGKSTLIDVILGLLTPQQGVVRVDGQDIAANLRGWQDSIGYVPQNIFLTDDTLRRNIAFGLADSHIDDVSVWRALKAAQLDQFVNSLPEGIETVVGERGVRLSGGQLQRIGIARALYHDPPVLVLDEATSALDTATESGVMDAAFLLKNKTILIVTHRLSTVERCDRVYRLDDGRIVQEGPPGQMVGSGAESIAASLECQ
jgi:ATP-binding cassette, subfamily B, bacterial PglK